MFLKEDFLGLDNIGVFRRSHGISRWRNPGTGRRNLLDCNCNCLKHVEMALEIAPCRPSRFEDMDHEVLWAFFLYSEALKQYRSGIIMGHGMNGEVFFYENFNLAAGESVPIKVRSISGLVIAYSGIEYKKKRYWTTTKN